MNKITLYVGLNDKDTKRQEISTVEACKIIYNLVTSNVDGCSVFEGHGVYKHNNGSIVIETSLKVELYDITDDQAYAIIDLLKRALNQESIILQREVVNSEFV